MHPKRLAIRQVVSADGTGKLAAFIGWIHTGYRFRAGMRQEETVTDHGDRPGERGFRADTEGLAPDAITGLRVNQADKAAGVTDEQDITALYTGM